MSKFNSLGLIVKFLPALLVMVPTLVIASDSACKSAIERTVKQSNIGFDSAEKQAIRNAKVVLVGLLPEEIKTGWISTGGLGYEVDTQTGKIFTFEVKKDICHYPNQINIEDYTRLKLIEYEAGQRAHRDVINQEIWNKNSGLPSGESLSQTALYQKYVSEALKYQTDLLQVKQNFRLVGYKILQKNQPIIESSRSLKGIPEGSLNDELMKRFKALKLANFTASAGTFWKTPDPNSIASGANFQLYAVADALGLLVGQERLPDPLKDRFRVKTTTDMTTFEGNKSKVSQITSIEMRLNDVDDSNLHFTNHYIDFADTPGDCNGNRHCEKNVFNSVGVNFSLTNSLKMRSKFYAEFDLIKFSNKPFEADVIKMTSDGNPFWPMLIKNRAVQKEPGLLLGYVLQAGFLAQVSNRVPQLLPFLEAKYGSLEVFAKAIMQGSTIIKDDPDALALEVGFQIRYKNQYLIGFSATQTSEMNGHSYQQYRDNGRHQLTAMFFVSVPLIVEPEYEDENLADLEFPKKLKLEKVEFVSRLFDGKPAHFNVDESQQRTLETGINAAAALGRFAFELGLMHTQTKGTALAPNPGSYETGVINVKYALSNNGKVWAIAQAMGDNFASGNQQTGIGVQLKPLAGTAIEERGVKLDITALYHPTSSYCVVTRCNQSLDGFWNDNNRRERQESLYIYAAKSFEFPEWTRLTSKLGIMGEVGVYSRLYMRNLNYGYMSFGIVPSLVQKDLGLKLGFYPYSTDFNIGAPSGVRLVGDHAKAGMTGTHYDLAAFEMTIDVLKTTDFVRTKFGNKAEPEKNQNILPVTISGNSERSSVSEDGIEKLAHVNLKSLPDPDFDQTEVYEMLSIIASAIAERNNSVSAQKAYELVPYLILNLAKKEFFTAKALFAKGKYEAATNRLMTVHKIYDDNQDYATIELSENANLQSLLRYTFTKHPQWKTNIQALKNQILGESTYCLSASLKQHGRDEEAAAYLAQTSYRPPNYLARSLRSFVTSEKFCVQ